MCVCVGGWVVVVWWCVCVRVCVGVVVVVVVCVCVCVCVFVRVCESMCTSMRALEC